MVIVDFRELRTIVTSSEAALHQLKTLMSGLFKQPLRPSLAVCPTSVRLWLWDSRAVPRNNLRLICKDLAAAGVHEHLYPLYIVGAVRRVITKRLDTREILQPAPLLVLERL